uniref:Uncharacterized protein n=1 Tax=Chenopodium quinoa TaxID=63459 RepID=A0A803N9E0_CHEQI
MEISPNKSVEVLDEVAGVLNEFKDVMQTKLPQNLPPRPAIDQIINIEPSALPPARSPYWMSLGELAELRTHLNDLLATACPVERALDEYDFEWEHKPGWHNVVPDALIRRCHELVTALIVVESKFTEKVGNVVVGDASYEKLEEQIESLRCGSR